MKLGRILLVAALSFATFSAQAAPACYAPAQEKAEHLLRLHSELMVITVTCRQGSQGEDLSAVYVDFTRKNLAVLRGAEQTMISYYKANGGGDALGRLDRLRTILGNEYGQKAANMSAPAFCAAFRDRVLAFDSASPAEIDGEVRRMEVSERTYAKPCGEKKPTVARRG